MLCCSSRVGDECCCWFMAKCAERASSPSCVLFVCGTHPEQKNKHTPACFYVYTGGRGLLLIIFCECVQYVSVCVIRCCPHRDRKISRGRWLLLLGYGNFFGAWCVCACDLHPDQKNKNVGEGCYGWINVRFVLCSWCVFGAVRTAVSYTHLTLPTTPYV